MSEPDRFDAQAEALFPEHVTCTPSCTYIARVAAALRAEHASALERAAQWHEERAARVEREAYSCPGAFLSDTDRDYITKRTQADRDDAVQIRALIPPAAAPAAEPTRNDPCQRCGKLGGHPVDFSFDGISMSSWICPHCLVAQEKRLAELETALVKIRDGCGYGLGHDIPWVRDVAKSALAARAAPPDGKL